MDPATRAKVDAILARIVARGGRRTASRQAIIESIATAGSHVTAEEIAGRVQARFPSVNVSTVYRTLDALTESGVVEHVHFGHGPATYHLADDAHQHMYCQRCGGVVEVPAKKLESFVRVLEREFGFAVDRRHFAIVGLCSACRQE